MKLSIQALLECAREPRLRSRLPFPRKSVTSRSAQPQGGRTHGPTANGDSMKLSMERSALLRAMSRAQSVVERRNTIPILANVLIEAEGDQVSFRATDLDIEVIDRAPAMVSRARARPRSRRTRCTRSPASCPTARWSS